MTAQTITPTPRFARHALVLALCLCLAPFGWASDPDDDWGLPATPVDGEATGWGSPSANGDQGPGSQVSAAMLVEVFGEFLFGAELASESGVLEVGNAAGLAVEATSVSEAGEAQLTAATPHQEVRVAPGPAQGLNVQGHVRLDLSTNMTVALKAPSQVVHQVTLLVLDDGQLGSLDDLVNGPSGLDHVEHAISLGAVDTLDLSKLHKQVGQHANALAGKAVSVMVISVDGLGVSHVTAARLRAGESSIEVLAQ